MPNNWTAGSWKASPCLGGYEISSPEDACWIARVQNHRGCISTKPGDANAHLIAAAPDLYEALEKLWRAVGLSGCTEPVLQFIPERIVRDALAAARGETTEVKP